MNTRDKNNNNDNKKSNESAIRIKSVTYSDHRHQRHSLLSYMRNDILLKFGFISASMCATFVMHTRTAGAASIQSQHSLSEKW